MLGNSNSTSPTVISDHPDLPLPVALTRLRRARRLRLRVDHDRGLLKLTIPWRMATGTALAWAAEQREWVDRQLVAAPPARPFAIDCSFPLEGREIVVRHDPQQRRSLALQDGELVVGGPLPGLAQRVERWCRARARDRLSEQTAALAATAGVDVRSVSVGDPVSRWGSCSSSGAIRYSWRLILAPPDVLRFVVAHEVAHRLHMDHSPAFKEAEERLFGAPVAAARLELRRLGPSLRAVGRD
jgi:predicted metal-dependent hydrolase